MPEPSDRDVAVAVMAWGIGRGVGDCRMIAQEKGDLPAAYPEPNNPCWQTYAGFATYAYDALINASFRVTAPSLTAKTGKEVQ